MQKTFFLTAFFIITTVITRAQAFDTTSATQSDTISIEKKGGGYLFFQNDKELKIKQLQTLLHTNDQAYKYFKSAKASNTIGTIFGYAGGFLIGWPLGTAIGGGKPNWAIAGVGAGLVGISIPFMQSAKKKTRKAVSEYNSTLTSNSSTRFNELNFGMTNHGAGIVFKF